jgi:hypothetical protein
MQFDNTGRFIIQNFLTARPFSSFLPGIAGPLGIPMWVFYVNRGQAIASFGIENKNNPIMEFQPANKAYQTTPYTGFRTFLKVKLRDESVIYEPFSPWNSHDSSQMFIGMNELELCTISSVHGIQTNVLYFTVPYEDFAGLVRQVTITNLGDESIEVEILDGMAAITPYGVTDWDLKHMGRTIEAWMEVFNLDQRIPFFRLRSSAEDTAEVEAIRAGHFYLTFTVEDGQSQLLPAWVDPTAVFGHNSALNTPDVFVDISLADLKGRHQIAVGKTPCGLFGTSAFLNPADRITLYAIIGHIPNIEFLHRRYKDIARESYIDQKRDEAHQLAHLLTEVINTQTRYPIFDAYCRQTFLDNILRGGWPLLLGGEKKSFVYHIYSRKHGDLERDYNDFFIAAEMYSQGNGNYRDVNQNRRCDVRMNPRVGDYNIFSFLGLIQADGYNPLVVEGSRFTIPVEKRPDILALVDQPHKLEPLLTQSFTPGQLIKTIFNHQIGLTVTLEEFMDSVLNYAVQEFKATFGEGYWIDHWFYNLDLINTYLAIYPDKKDEMLFDKPIVPFFDSHAVVQPRSKKYVLVDDEIRQYGAVQDDREKTKLIASRAEHPNLMRVAHGQGDVYRTTVFAKLVGIALIKFATLDPLGMGIEMEAGKPGWYDALNGLPGLFGSSLSETYELARLLKFLLGAMAEKEAHTLDFPVEQVEFLEKVAQALEIWENSDDPERDYEYWDTVTNAREVYRQITRLGFDGQTSPLTFSKLSLLLSNFLSKVQTGIDRAETMNNGVPPTYFAYDITDYELITGDDGNFKCDEKGRPYIKANKFKARILPLFLEGVVHALKFHTDEEAARQLYNQVKNSDLFDQKLKMYKVNASLEDQSHEIGRARVFSPGWLENESIWLHMEYKYLLEVLRAGLYDEFFTDFKNTLVPFLKPETYGRSPLENSSFIVSSAHPDETLHGVGFVARLSGSTAEFLSIWSHMMVGERPFFFENGQLNLAFKPVLPGWLFTEEGTISFKFLGHCTVTYHNPKRQPTYKDGLKLKRIELHMEEGRTIEFKEGVIYSPYAVMVRNGEVDRIDVHIS